MQTNCSLSLRSKFKEHTSEKKSKRPLENNAVNSNVQIQDKPLKEKALKNSVRTKKLVNNVAQLENRRIERRKKRGNRKYKAFTRQLWKSEEDDAISTLVREHGVKKWTLIAHKLQEEYKIYGKTGKQCRER